MLIPAAVTFMENKALELISTVIQLEVHMKPPAKYANQLVIDPNYEVE